MKILDEIFVWGALAIIASLVLGATIGIGLRSCYVGVKKAATTAPATLPMATPSKGPIDV